MTSPTATAPWEDSSCDLHANIGCHRNNRAMRRIANHRCKLIVGSAMDLFHKNAGHQRKMMDGLTDEEINNLIFLPGFSTAEKISDISGRGVGMDVVRRNIQAAREARRLGRRAVELIDHLAFGHGDAAERHGKADLLRRKFHFDLAEPDFTGERMIAAIAALRQIAECQQEALVAAGEILRAQIAVCREAQGILREIAHARVVAALRRALDQIVGGGLRFEEAMRVIEGWAQHLAARWSRAASKAPMVTSPSG